MHEGDGSGPSESRASATRARGGIGHRFLRTERGRGASPYTRGSGQGGGLEGPPKSRDGAEKPTYSRGCAKALTGLATRGASATPSINGTKKAMGGGDRACHEARPRPAGAQRQVDPVARQPAASEGPTRRAGLRMPGANGGELGRKGPKEFTGCGQLCRALAPRQVGPATQ